MHIRGVSCKPLIFFFLVSQLVAPLPVKMAVVATLQTDVRAALVGLDQDVNQACNDSCTTFKYTWASGPSP